MGGKKRLTNDEAIYVLKNTAWLGSAELVGDVTEAVRMAVEALKTQLPKEDTTSDCISRQEAIRIASGYCHFTNVAKELEKLPSVQPDIIHCKDCKHSEHWYRDKSRCFLWHEEGIDVFEDGFCNYAERRADGRD